MVHRNELKFRVYLTFYYRCKEPESISIVISIVNSYYR